MIIELKMEIVIQYLDDSDLPDDARCVASIKSPATYIGTVVASDCISGCFMELSKSLKVMELYEANKKLVK